MKEFLNSIINYLGMNSVSCIRYVVSLISAWLLLCSGLCSLFLAIFSWFVSGFEVKMHCTSSINYSTDSSIGYSTDGMNKIILVGMWQSGRLKVLQMSVFTFLFTDIKLAECKFCKFSTATIFGQKRKF